MRIVYLASVWLHILAATVWIGGIFFLVLVVVPWLRSGTAKDAGTFLRETGERFRFVGWICFALLLVTGSFNLWVRGARVASLVDPAWWSTSLGSAALLKLLLFAAVVAVSAVHDFSVGPRATVAMERDIASPESRRLRRQASILGRINGVLALLLAALGVVLVRGWP